MTVLTLNIHHKGHRGHEVPALLKAICFGILSKVFCMHVEKPAHPAPTYQSNTVRRSNGVQ